MAAKAAKLAQVGQLYFGGVGQFYIGANTVNPLVDRASMLANF